MSAAGSIALAPAAPARCGAALVAVALLLSAAGCVGLGPDDYSRCPERYVSLNELVAEYNANAAKVPRLWARAAIQVRIEGWPVWGERPGSGISNGYVLLWKEADRRRGLNFQLRGRQASVDVFRLGADAASGLYYFWMRAGSAGRAWVGRQRLAGAPAVKAVPIDPLQLAEILCVNQLPEVRPGKMPAVVLRLRGRPCAYVVRYLKPQPLSGQLKVWREVSFHWGGPTPRRPFRVRLFDADGLCRMIADLEEYRPIEWDGPAEDAPVMPTDIRITCPKIKGVQPGCSLRLELSEMSAVRRVPKRAFAPGIPPGLEVEVVDEAAGPIQEKPNRP